MTKYTAEDFANARFAEHANGNTATRKPGLAGPEPWVCAIFREFRGDADLAECGWVPVPTRPTLTDSQVGEIVATWESDDYLTGFIAGYQHAGGVILDDPEPTNTERLMETLNEYGVGRGVSSRGLAKYLNDHGVTAPELKDN